MNISELTDRFAIRELIENWVVWRDSGQWERLAGTFHPDGWMVATWQTAPARDFVAGSQAAWDKGAKASHTLSGSSIDISDNRAVAQTKMSIMQRTQVDDIWVEVTCRGRFYDFLEKRDGRWGILLRQPIYEFDRIDALEDNKIPHLERSRLERWPEGYRHLAYIQSLMGANVRTDLPGLRGPEVEALYAHGASWLNEAISPIPE